MDVPAKLDEIDEKIINELTQNAKLPLREVALKLKVSFVTVMNRMRKLERQGIIRRYAAIIDWQKLGYDTFVIIEVRISKGKLLELEKKIAHYPSVCGVYDTTGEYDAIVLAKFKSTRAMDAFLKKIQTLDFVERTRTMLVLNTIKEEQVRI